MKDYTNAEPVFSEYIRIAETSDPAHADNINEAPKQILQNTLVNRGIIENQTHDISALMRRIGLLELMYAAEISKNPFMVTFDSLDGLSASGVWNVPMKRIEF